MAIFNNFFQFARKIKRRSRFLQSVSQAIWQNEVFIDKLIRIKWHLFYASLYKSGNAFFKQNATRVDTILNKLADEESKQVYSTIVKFRTTLRKKDYSSEYYNPQTYFIKEVNFEKAEVFIDCGACDGDTMDDFMKLCPDYKQIVAFEPETTNFEKLKAKYENNPKIMLVNAGTWHKEEIVSFTGGGVAGAISASGNGTICTKSIDSLELDRVTFIKMDIEGAEMNALKGASQTILHDKPKLAICIYHSNEDMLDIPEYIHNLVPEYKLYVRQHSIYPWWETVLYAVL